MTFADCAALRMWRQKTRAKGAVKGSTSLRKMGSSTSLFSSVGLRRPPAFGLPVPLRAQSLGYGSVQRSAFRKKNEPKAVGRRRVETTTCMGTCITRFSEIYEFNGARVTFESMQIQ